MGLIIELKDVRKNYVLPKVTIEVLKGIDMEVEEGGFIAVMGPSGSGKSTLLHIVGCLDRPTEGLYMFEGMDINSKSDNELAGIRNSRIGFVFQGFNLLPRFPAWKNVELPLLYSDVPAKERRTRAYALLGKVGLADRETHAPNELSGGEQQRVAIARALVNNPSVVLADEPTGNLDSRSGVEIMRIFSGLNREGVTIIMVTHEMSVAEIAQKIITIKDGVCSIGCF
ncbi:MAG: ABC transporter ATP-binding protein [Thermodesulfovibrionales bacterium]|nr:ABC transporter ATP-binding protein [Thermodesulfovibrionales bacterium]